MSDAPAAVEAVPEQQEGGEQGSGGPGENYGEGVDAFNDQCSQRPDSGGMDAQGDNAEGFEGEQEGDSSFFEGDGDSDFSEGWDVGGFEGDQGDSDFQPSEEGSDIGPESQDGSEESPPPGDGLDDLSEDGGPEDTAQEGGQEGTPEGSDQSKGKSDEDQRGGGADKKPETPSTGGDGKRENDKSSQSEKGKKPPQGDNIFSRWQRGELTKKDLENIEKDQKKQKSGSAVPKGDWLPKGGGGSKHAQPKESRKGPSKIEQFQKEAKAKAQKWDDVQTWNQKMVERAKAQYEEMWEGVKKAGKGR